LRRKDFRADSRAVAEALVSNGFVELPITAAHAARVAELPAIHGDPFDRMLVAQSVAEPMMLVTGDALLARYGSFVKVV
jgi:PIN domain nuclease of toxin-antitoxin system